MTEALVDLLGQAVGGEGLLKPIDGSQSGRDLALSGDFVEWLLQEGVLVDFLQVRGLRIACSFWGGFNEKCQIALTSARRSRRGC
jgi:hypothetical protein